MNGKSVLMMLNGVCSARAPSAAQEQRPCVSQSFLLFTGRPRTASNCVEGMHEMRSSTISTSVKTSRSPFERSALQPRKLVTYILLLASEDCESSNCNKINRTYASPEHNGLDYIDASLLVSYRTLCNIVAGLFEDERANAGHSASNPDRCSI